MNVAKQEAEEFVLQGKGDWLAHFIDDDHSGGRGISNPLRFEDWQRGGFTSSYYRIKDIAEPENWND